jgi:hypothetical protein
MSGINPYITIQEIAARVKDLNSYASINAALDELEYLFEVIPPELQEPAETLIAQLTDKLNSLN